MSFFTESQKKFRKRNIDIGRETAALGDTRRAGFAQALQGMRTQGISNVANIRQAGLDRRLASEQEYGLPLQEQETEAARLGNVGTEFYQGLTKKYGEGFMRDMLGLEHGIEPTQESYAKLLSREWPPVPEELGPKADVATPRGYGVSGTWGEPEETSLFDKFKSLFGRRKKDKYATESFGIAGVRG